MSADFTCNEYSFAAVFAQSKLCHVFRMRRRFLFVCFMRCVCVTAAWFWVDGAFSLWLQLKIHQAKFIRFCDNTNASSAMSTICTPLHKSLLAYITQRQHQKYTSQFQCKHIIEFTFPQSYRDWILDESPSDMRKRKEKTNPPSNSNRENLLHLMFCATTIPLALNSCLL